MEKLPLKPPLTTETIHKILMEQSVIPMVLDLTEVMED